MSEILTHAIAATIDILAVVAIIEIAKKLRGRSNNSPKDIELNIGDTTCSPGNFTFLTVTQKPPSGDLEDSSDIPPVPTINNASITDVFGRWPTYKTPDDPKTKLVLQVTQEVYEKIISQEHKGRVIN